MLLDTSKFHTQEYSALFAQYEEAKKWLESHGIKVSPTRFQQYKKAIEKSLQPSSEPYNLGQDMSLLWAFAELHDLTDIHSNFKQSQDPRVVENLKKLATGPTLLENEKSDGGSIHGRNFAFELYAASRLARGGFAIEFDTIADASFLVKDTRIYMECKRVVNENNMEELIASACKQIAKRCEGNRDSHGIAAVSISKLVWKALSESAPGVHANIADLRLAMIANLDKWGPIIIDRFKRFNQHTMAILLHYKMPFRDRSTGAPGFLNRFSIYPLCESTAPEMPLLTAIRTALYDSTNPDGR